MVLTCFCPEKNLPVDWTPCLVEFTSLTTTRGQQPSASAWCDLLEWPGRPKGRGVAGLAEVEAV